MPSPTQTGPRATAAPALPLFARRVSSRRRRGTPHGVVPIAPRSPHGTPRSDAALKVFSAARHGKSAIVEDYLIDDASAFCPENSTDSHGNTLFHVACQNGNKKIAKLSIKYGGDMNRQNLRGNTGLHFLYQFGYADVAEYFIGKGADPNVTNRKGFSCKQGFKGDIPVTG